LIDGAIARATAGPPRRLLVAGRIDDDIEYVVADPVRLQEVVTHLVSNAVRFTPDGGRVTITVRRAPVDEVHITVTDTGVGIAPDQREHVFDAFSPGPAVGGQVRVGTGTGLALARGLVEVHGGRLWLTSRTGHGSTFTVALSHQSATTQPLAGRTP
jgi:signal transduction histidine kinase